MELNQEQIDLLEQFAMDNDTELRTDYSGRCMFGRSCIGFVTDESPFSLGFNLCSFLEDEIATKLDEDSEMVAEIVDAFNDAGSSMDSMGLSSIIYFPSISFED